MRVFFDDRAAFRARLFGSSAVAGGSLMQACLSGERDLKDVLAEVLPSVGYQGSVTAFVAYWFEKASSINPEVPDAAKRLGRHAHVALYLVVFDGIEDLAAHPRLQSLLRG